MIEGEGQMAELWQNRGHFIADLDLFQLGEMYEKLCVVGYQS
jgi:hypothetical protein